MATYTTDNKAVGNQIGLAQLYLPILDDVYKATAKSSILDMANANVRYDGGNTAKVFKTSIQGLGNYSRNSGFVTGDVTGTWEDMTLEYDRGRGFLVDTMDNEESMGMAFGSLAGEFIRTQVTPEVDAIRFAKYASTSGISAGTPADITTSSNVADLLDEAMYTMDEDEVPEEGRIAFVSEAAYRQLKGNLTRYLLNDQTGVNTNVEMYNGLRIIRVPQARFNTAITLADGITSGQEAGGFTPTAGGYKINFLVVHPSAVVQIAKHVVPRIFSPDVNQSADAWLFQYRIYHGVDVLDNKVAGIYLHRGATANT